MSYRARSEAEVRRRLARTYSPAVIEAVVDWLKSIRYLDDASFARQWRTNRERLRPRGQRALRQELFRLGVSAEVIQESLEGFDADANAYRAGQKAAQRLFGNGYPEFRQKLWAYLRRRGFDDSVISGAVTRLWQELASDSLDGSIGSQGDE